MLKTKKDVDRHVQQIIDKIPSEYERNLKGFTVAKLYLGVGDLESARKHLIKYISVRENSSLAYKLYGELCESQGKIEKAIECYKQSFELDQCQKDLVLKICSLFLSFENYDSENIKYWVEKGESLYPLHGNVQKLRDKMNEDRRSKGEEDEKDEAPSVLWSTGSHYSLVPKSEKSLIFSTPESSTPVRRSDSMTRRFTSRPSPDKFLAHIQRIEDNQDALVSTFTNKLSSLESSQESILNKILYEVGQVKSLALDLSSQMEVIKRTFASDSQVQELKSIVLDIKNNLPNSSKNDLERAAVNVLSQQALMLQMTAAANYGFVAHQPPTTLPSFPTHFLHPNAVLPNQPLPPSFIPMSQPVKVNAPVARVEETKSLMTESFIPPISSSSSGHSSITTPSSIWSGPSLISSSPTKEELKGMTAPISSIPRSYSTTESFSITLENKVSTASVTAITTSSLLSSIPPPLYSAVSDFISPTKDKIRQISVGSHEGSFTESEIDPLPDFKPIISLPEEVEIVTGEEDEEILYEERSKVFRFLHNEWKERGLGQIKILKHKVNGKIRVLMRRDQTHKVCLNHFLLPDMKIEKMKNSETALSWIANDFSDEESKVTTFSAKFKTAEIALRFRTAFQNSISSLLQSSSFPPISSSSLSLPSSFPPIESISSSLDAFKSKPGSTWECSGCLNRNDVSLQNCPSCQSTRFEKNNKSKDLTMTPTMSTNMTSKSFASSSPFATFSSLSTTSKSESNSFVFSNGEEPSKIKTVQGNANSLTFGFESPRVKLESDAKVFSVFGDSKTITPTLLTTPSVHLKTSESFEDNKTTEEETEDEEEDNDNDENELSDETEKVLIESNCQLMKLSEKDWIDMGSGSIKILLEDSSEKTRIMVRRDAPSLSVLLNHGITSNTLIKKDTGVNVVSWTNENQTYEAHFKSSQEAEEFKKTFETQIPKIVSWDAFKLKEGSWECSGCLCRNNGDIIQCPACNTLKSGVSAPPSSAAPQTPFAGFSFGNNLNSGSGFSFGSPSSSTFKFGAPQSGFSFSLPPNVTTEEDNNKNNNKDDDNEDDDDGNAEENHDPCADFKPIIPLPDEIEVKTGEEDEDIFHEVRSKLYRYIDKEWKERGLGTAKILKHKISGKFRFILRREQTQKICANHFISSDMSIQKFPSNPKACIWLANDFSDEKSVVEKFSLRFKTVEQSDKFLEMFNSAISSSCKSSIISHSSEEVTNKVTSSVSHDVVVSKGENEKERELYKMEDFVLRPSLTTKEKVLSFENQKMKLDTEKEASEVSELIISSTPVHVLILSGNTFGIEAARGIGKALEKHPELIRAQWKDMFTGRMKTEIPLALTHLSNGLMKAQAQLVELDLSDNAFGPIGMEGLKNLLVSPSCFTLKELRLNNTGCGVTGGKHLAALLNESYEKSKKMGHPLSLRVFVLGRSRQENGGAIALAEVFKKMGSLEEVVMPQNGIYHEGIAALMDAFSHNPKLSILNMNDNTFTEIGAKSLAETLPFLPQLSVLNVGDCLLKTAGAQRICRALKSHENLRKLNMSSNEIQIKGGLSIIDSLASKTTLVSLNLDGNQFRKEGIEKILGRLSEMNRSALFTEILDDEEPDEREVEDEDSATLFTNIFGGSSSNFSIFGNKGSSGVGDSVFSGIPVTTTPSLFGGGSGGSIGSSTFAFGSSTNVSNLPSFSSLTQNLTSSSFAFGKRGEEFQFENAGASVFGSKKEILDKKKNGETENDEQEDGEEGNDPDPYFAPIIALPELVSVTTGEEEEQVIFQHRAKLYRFETGSKEWKERGVGDIKILHHGTHKTYRVLLRRDQILKTACNHLITSEMALKPMMTNKASLTWFAMDFAEQVAKLEQFAVRFKTEEKMNDFKRVFEECQSHLAQNDNDDDDEEEAEDDGYNDEDEDETELMFIGKCELSERLEEEAKGGSSLGFVTLRIITDEDVCGARILATDSKDKIVCNHLIAMQSKVYVHENKSSWSAFDFSSNPPLYRYFEAKFSNEEENHKFKDTFYEGIELARDSDILENPGEDDDPEFYGEGGDYET